MSNILDQIDDTLENWHGSADSMEWHAEPPLVERITVTLTADDSHWLAAVARLQGSIGALAGQMATLKPVFEHASAAFRALEPHLPESRPSALNAGYHRRYRNRQGRR
jgi:hypothetical protein